MHPGLVADRSGERAQTEVAGPAQESFARKDDERQGFRREAIVAEPSAVELAEDESLDGVGSQPGQRDGVSDARADFLGGIKR